MSDPQTAVIQQADVGQPDYVIYKTNGNYVEMVPVTLSADRTKIVNYPAPSDIQPDQKPLALKKGYLFDRRGINMNSAFTNWSYEQYAAIKGTPDIRELYSGINDLNPVTEIYVCSRNEIKSDPITEINNWISNGLLESKCKRLK